MQTEEVIFENIYVYTYVYMLVTIIFLKNLNMKEIRKEYMEEFRKRDDKGEM